MEPSFPLPGLVAAVHIWSPLCPSIRELWLQRDNTGIRLSSGLDDRMQGREERKGELGDITLEIAQSEQRRENR